MEYEFYLDVFWVTNFLMNVLVLFLVRYIKKRKSSLGVMALGAGFGAAASAFLFLTMHWFLLYQAIVHLVVNPLVVYLCFPTKRMAEFFKNLFLTYVFTLLLGGILNWGMSTKGSRSSFWIWVLGGFAVCMFLINWLGREKKIQQDYEILLVTEEQKLPLRGFLDTGNLLMDPIVHKPVHIIQQEVLEEIITREELPCRYIPFHSLGQEHGLLQVVTLKAMYIKGADGTQKELPLYIEKPVFGLAKEKLFQKKKYQVILNAGCIST